MSSIMVFVCFFLRGTDQDTLDQVRDMPLVEGASGSDFESLTTT